MSEHRIHGQHSHVHGPGCGHRAVKHDGHVDYLHDGHLHSMHGDHVDEHTIPVDAAHPDACTPGHSCNGHGNGHVHGANCGHEAVPHGDHVDYLVVSASVPIVEKRGGCYVVDHPDPEWAGARSATMRGTICAEPIAHFTTARSPSASSRYDALDTYVFDVRRGRPPAVLRP